MRDPQEIQVDYQRAVENLGPELAFTLLVVCQQGRSVDARAAAVVNLLPLGQTPDQ